MIGSVRPVHDSSQQVRRAVAGKRKFEWLQDIPYSVAAFASGLIFGLSAPGVEQWYLAWFGLVPLFLLTFRSAEPSQAAFRGFLFGAAYNLVYLSWSLAVRDVFWEAWFGELGRYSLLLRSVGWVSFAACQGLFVGVFCCVVRALPLTAGWLPERRGAKWFLPALLVVPLLWCLIIEKLGNMPNLMGVPWSMIQYSQYKQLAIIQCASVIGGTGLAAVIVAFNLTLATLINSLPQLRKGNWQAQAFHFASGKPMVPTMVITLVVALAVPIAGFSESDSYELYSDSRTMTVSALQTALTNKVHKVSSMDIAEKFLDLSRESPGGLCVFPEWAFVTNISEDGFLEVLAPLAQQRNQRWVVGLLDEMQRGKVHNAVAAVDVSGKLMPSIYHKNYLVPFGEYTPAWLIDSLYGWVFFREGVQEQTQPGSTTHVFKLADVNVGPVVCFENLLPELCARNTRDGAQILVDCSNTSWFHKSILSDQMVAFCVMRAVENHRAFVFATTMGPSTIISPVGKILRQAPRDSAAAISWDVPLEEDITPFTRMCY